MGPKSSGGAVTARRAVAFLLNERGSGSDEETMLQVRVIMSSERPTGTFVRFKISFASVQSSNDRLSVKTL